MKRILACIVLILSALCLYVLRGERQEREVRISVEAQIKHLAESVDRMTQLMERVLQERNLLMPGQLYASWYSAGSPPILREVTTTRMEGETVRSWEDRHDAAVANLRTTYPPV